MCHLRNRYGKDRCFRSRTCWSFLGACLKEEGYDVELYEKRSDMREESRDGGRSINLIATSRALNAFTAVGILEDIKKIVVPVTGRMMHSLEGELTYQPYGVMRVSVTTVFHVRFSILLFLIRPEEAGVKLFFSQELENLEPDNGKATFAGKKVEFDRFFGADGAGSITRKELLSYYARSE